MTNNKAIEDFRPSMCSLEVLHAEASTKLIRTQWEKIISSKMDHPKTDNQFSTALNVKMTKSTSNIPGHQYPQQEGSRQQGGYDIS